MVNMASQWRNLLLIHKLYSFIMLSLSRSSSLPCCSTSDKAEVSPGCLVGDLRQWSGPTAALIPSSAVGSLPDNVIHTTRYLTPARQSV